MSKKSHTVPKHILYKNITYTDSETMSNCFNNFLVNIGNSVEAKIPQVDTLFNIFLKDKNNNTFFIKPVDENEIKSMISKLVSPKLADLIAYQLIF